MAIKKKLSKLEKQKLDPTSRYWKRKALAVWSEIVRQPRYCEICGNDKKVLNAHHLLPKERYQEYMYEPMNGVCLCQMCHKWAKLSAHANPIWFTVWLMKNKPVHYRWVIKRMELPASRPSHKDAYEALTNHRNKQIVLTTAP